MKDIKDIRLEDIDIKVSSEYINLVFLDHINVTVDRSWLYALVSIGRTTTMIDVIRLITSNSFIKNIVKLLMDNMIHWQEFTINKLDGIYALPCDDNDLEVFHDFIAWEQAYAIRKGEMEEFMKDIISLINKDKQNEIIKNK